MPNSFLCNVLVNQVLSNSFRRRTGSAISTCLAILALAPLVVSRLASAAPVQQKAAPPAARRFARNAMRQNRLSFVPDSGPAASATRFSAIGPGFQISLDKDAMTLLSLHAAPAPVAGSRAEGAVEGRGLAALPPGSLRTLPALTAKLTRLRFVGANPDVRMEGRDPSEAKVNILLGNDPAKWRRKLVTYGSVHYAGLYPGVDLVYYGEKNGQLEFDLVVAPGTDPSVVRLKVDGDQDALLDENGDLRLGGKEGDALLRSPMLYQDIANGKRAIGGSFVQTAKNEFGLKPAQYDHSKPLIIDPTFSLLYSTFMGGIHLDQAGALALDAANNVYITGVTASQDFPVSANAFMTQLVKPYEYELNTFVMKFDSSGTLLYSTYLGGSGLNGILSDAGHPGDEPAARAVGIDAAGNVYVAGTTTSGDFPVTANAYQATNMGTENGYLVELSPDGSTLEYGSYFGGTSTLLVGSMARASNGQIYVAGSAGPGLPTTAGAYKTTLAAAPSGQQAPYQAAYLSVFDITKIGASQLVGSTYYGTDTPQANTIVTGNLGYTMALDSKGDPWLVGQAYTNNLPTTSNALQPTLPALTTYCGNSGGPLNSAGYIVEFNPALTTLQYASYLSGANQSPNSAASCSEYLSGLAFDSADNIYVDGVTSSSTFPVTTGALQTALPAMFSYSEVITKLNTGGATINWATYLGGSTGNTFSGDLTPDSAGDVWAVGITNGGSNFPITSDAYQSTSPSGGDYAGFIEGISPDGSKLVYGTFFGGEAGTTPLDVAVDANENVYVVGATTNTAFPVTATAVQPLFANGDQNPDSSDAFFSILGAGTIGVITPIIGGNTGDSTITVDGAGFQQGATCSLVEGGVTIASVQATVNSSGTAISCTFALNGAATGSYNVVVTNPDGSSYTKQGAFTVESGTGPNITTNLIGRALVRTGTPATYDLTAINTGDSDAYFTQIWLVIPDNFLLTVPQGIYDPYPEDPNGTTDLSGFIYGLTDSDGYRYYSVLVPHMQPGESASFPFQITVPDNEASFDLQTYNRLPWFSSLSDTNAALQSAQTNPASLADQCSPGSDPSTRNCLAPYVVDASNGILETQYAGDTFTNPSQSQQSLETYIAQRLQELLVLAAAPSPLAKSTAIDGESHESVRPLVKGGGGSSSGSKWDFSEPMKQLWSEYWNNGGGKKTVDWILCQPVEPPTRTVIQACGCGVTEQIVQLTYTCGNRLYGNGTLSFTLHSACPPAQPKKKKKNSGGGTLCMAGAASGTASRSSAPLTGFGFKRRLLADDASTDSCDSEDNGDTNGGSDSCGGSADAIDPNFKTGSFGDLSAAAYVQGQKPLTYTVGFENEPTATLPAATVVVTDQLDPAKIDLTTVSLGNIAFGTNVINLPTGTNSYATTYALPSVTNYVVRIQGSLNSSTGLLKWTFQTIDPTTSLPPTDPTVGFLPPDVDGIVGQGSVLFNVMPKPGQSTGTQITNQAIVVFDANAPISTPTWLNTLDVNPPVSDVTALPATEPTNAFTVSWSGTDVGSGIASYTIYASEDGGAFIAWQSNVTTTSATFTAPAAGHTYGFYSIATDGAGNVEAAKSAAEATTDFAGVSTATALTSSSAQVNIGSSVTLSATVAPGSGTAVPTGSVSFMLAGATLGSGTLSAAGAATYTTTSLPVGTDAITAVYSGDANFAPSTSAVVSVVVVQPTPDFSFASNPTTITVTAGASGSSTLTVTPVNGFNQSTTFSCSGLPTLASCNFSPTSVTPSGAAITTTVTISTTATTTTGMIARPGMGGDKTGITLALAGGLVVLFSRRRARRLLLLTLSLFAIAAGLLTSCGGGGPTKTTIPGTPAGTSTITITATAGTGATAIAHNTTITLTVH